MGGWGRCVGGCGDTRRRSFDCAQDDSFWVGYWSWVVQVGLFGGEGGGGEVGLVEEVGVGEAGPGVADVAGVFEGGAGDEDGVAFDDGAGVDELVIGAGELEAFGVGVEVRGFEGLGVIEPDADAGGVRGWPGGRAGRRTRGSRRRRGCGRRAPGGRRRFVCRRGGRCARRRRRG